MKILEKHCLRLSLMALGLNHYQWVDIYLEDRLHFEYFKILLCVSINAHRVYFQVHLPWQQGTSC